MALLPAELVLVNKRLTASQLEDEEKWNTLSTIIALEGIANNYHESHVDYSKEKGSLVVIGSGIKCVGQFSLEAISHLKNADKVLYCVADPATEHFIRDLCPDALDLYVLYANGKKRYETYVQMAEATLYFARQGLRTVMVFYGHPGIFVMPSHRCIQIAKQQGIETYMLPAISALDCLIADLNIDPSYPGLQTLEATDLLLRNRTLLTDVHVIIWQVGCVGDLGFTRTGYKNTHLSVLIEHLQGIYGKDYVITHYIGAQYPMCSPTIAKLPLNTILEPDVMKTITGISTFYIPPKEPKEIIPANAKRLGINVSELSSAGSPLVRPFAQYGPKEKKAIHDMIEWKVPHDYSHFSFTKIGEYIGKIAQDIGLFHKHKKEPVKTMEEEADLATNEMSVILKADRKQVHALMKANADSVATKVAVRILTDPKFASALNDTIKKHINDKNDNAVNEWLAFKGYSTTLTDVHAAFTQLQKTSLLPWTSIYSSNQSITLTIHGQPPSSSTPSKVLVNSTEIKNFTFTNQTLTWSSSNGNSSSASLVFKDNKEGLLSFTGKYWLSTSPTPTAANISGHNIATKASFSNWVGSYTSTLNAISGPEILVDAVQDSNYRVYIGHTEISHYTFGSDNTLSWSDSHNSTNGEIKFSVQNAGTPQVRRVFSGWYWGKGSTKPQAANFTGTINVANFTPYKGMYRSYYKDSKGASQYGDECFLKDESNSASFTIGTTAIKSPKYTNATITWSTTGGNADNGSITFHIDPESHTPSFNGRRWTGSTKPAKVNFWGSLDTTYLKEWAGVYTTYSEFDSSWTPAAQIVVNSATIPSKVQITYGGTAIKSPVFNNPILTWSKSAGNTTNASILFYYPSKSNVPKCFGKIWVSDQPPAKDNLIGEIDSQYLRSWTGVYNTYTPDKNGKFNVDAPQLSIFGGLTEADTTVFLGGVAITNFKYSKEGSSKYGYLTWSDSDNNTNGDITFFINDSLVRSFNGKYWKKGESKPTKVNWAGNTNPKPVASTSSYGGNRGGYYGRPPAHHSKHHFWTAENILNNIGMGLIIMGLIFLGKYIWTKYGTKAAEGAKEKFKDLQKKFKKKEEEAKDNDPSEEQDIDDDEALPNVRAKGSKLQQNMNNENEASSNDNQKLNEDNDADLIPDEHFNPKEFSVNIKPPKIDSEQPDVNIQIDNQSQPNNNESQQKENENDNDAEDDEDVNDNDFDYETSADAL